jgi:phosphatidylserine decarboxylase
VNSIGLRHVPQLFAVNERVAVEQRSEHHGPVTTILVGAIGVGRISVSFDDVLTNVAGASPGERRYDDGPPLDRAEELGTFHLGSTAIVFVGPTRALRFVVEPGARVRVGEAVLRIAKPAEAG